MNTDTPNIESITRHAHAELQQLAQQRADITKRIRRIKQTILGLCRLFGSDELSDDKLREFADCKPGTRRPGLTQACRTVLKNVGRPLTARELCEHILQQNLNGLRSSKNLVASVAVVLERLVQYGEARTVRRDNGRRVWFRASDTEDRSPHLAVAGGLVSDHD